MSEQNDTPQETPKPNNNQNPKKISPIIRYLLFATILAIAIIHILFLLFNQKNVSVLVFRITFAVYTVILILAYVFLFSKNKKSTNSAAPTTVGQAAPKKGYSIKTSILIVVVSILFLVVGFFASVTLCKDFKCTIGSLAGILVATPILVIVLSIIASKMQK